MNFKHIITILLLFVLVQTVYSFFQKGDKDAVLLKDVKVLTLVDNKMTRGSRSSPIKQLECAGGSARCQRNLLPQSVQCHNIGSDGTDVQWECKANLDTAVQFGKLDVSCEGYAYPEDPYILKGSCGLRYELEYTNSALRESYYKQDWATSIFTFFIWVFVIGVVGFIFYNIFFARNENDREARRRHQQQQQPNGVPYGGYMNGPSYYPGSAGFGSVPPAPQNYGSSWGNSSWLPFLGGLGTGYAFGRPRSSWWGGWNSHSNYYTPSYHSSPSYHHSSSSSSSRGTGVTSTSTGYSSTSRR
ncbi:DUF1183 family protein [Heterostelium album PN500]|uniref:Store-operated calcium entry-associated regulatory factor n=1 Tax=Heterostelium pallidum (strain ATCC 26659 / Pp 5 / PN500) TaxID=670386 RepID=D3B500_HETP5|nr:DUF1183 family protein [Heterostelium album PN500]EFA84398.1 DUF1183 family protein [Heterostelium album PN500]|eukprot:XP_020436512.1 DUF1183 family protein [Heterostelium album PN500]